MKKRRGELRLFNLVSFRDFDYEEYDKGDDDEGDHGDQEIAYLELLICVSEVVCAEIPYAAQWNAYDWQYEVLDECLNQRTKVYGKDEGNCKPQDLVIGEERLELGRQALRRWWCWRGRLWSQKLSYLLKFGKYLRVGRHDSTPSSGKYRNSYCHTMKVAQMVFGATFSCYVDGACTVNSQGSWPLALAAA